MPSEEDDIQNEIRGCQRNDRSAQEKLYKRFYRAMMTLCVRYTRNEQDALEVINDGFLKVFRHIGSYEEGKGSMYTWIRRIVINTAIDHVRKKQGYAEVEALPEGMHEPAIDNEAMSRISGEMLIRLIRMLPDATGLVFNLYTVDGYSHREIGILLGISEGTSRWHLSEARRQLKTFIHRIESNP